MDRLVNKVAIISGGGSGIGAATARSFAQEGAKVVVCGRRMAPLQDIVADIIAAGGDATALSCDVSSEKAVKQLVADTLDRYDRIDILVNNATLIEAGLLADQDADSWRKNFSVTVDGTMFMMREAHDALRASRGAVVNISSILALQSTPYMTGYAAAKSAVIAMGRTAAIEWAVQGIRVNTVIPGAFLTEPTLAVIPDEASKKLMEEMIPVKRIGDPAECANAILFLASDEASYITGTVLNVDGGRSAELCMGANNMEGFDT